MEQYRVHFKITEGNWLLNMPRWGNMHLYLDEMTEAVFKRFFVSQIDGVLWVVANKTFLLYVLKGDLSLIKNEDLKTILKKYRNEMYTSGECNTTFALRMAPESKIVDLEYVLMRRN